MNTLSVGLPVGRNPVGHHTDELIRDEFLRETLFTSFAQACVALEEGRRDYNMVRPHSRIG
jgi:transposase InsO family protein